MIHLKDSELVYRFQSDTVDRSRLLADMSFLVRLAALLLRHAANMWNITWSCPAPHSSDPLLPFEV